jgi:hypothetical protein
MSTTDTTPAPDWRELCDLHGTNLSDGDGPDTWNFTADQFAAALRDALAATREAAPVPPQGAEISDEELLELAAAAIDGYDVIPLGKFEPESDLQLTVAAYGSELIAYARAVWARAQAARPAIQPVPVSERPWERPGWLDAEGRCWCFAEGRNWRSDDFGYSHDRSWILRRPEPGIYDTNLLPHWALPLPAADQQEGQGDA